MAVSEKSPEWVHDRLLEVFARYSKEEVQRAMPALILQMCGEWGFDALDEDFQRTVLQICVKIGLEPDQAHEEMERRVTELVRELDPNPQLFADIQKVFETHHAAVGEESAEQYQQKFDQRPDKSAPQVNEDRPEGALAAEALARVMTGKIKS